jgi:hypothetical protein
MLYNIVYTSLGTFIAISDPQRVAIASIEPKIEPFTYPYVHVF